MRAVILAAGMGSRLRPITDYKPKTLVKVNDKPMLGYIIESLMLSSVNDIIICIGYRGEIIKNYCNNTYPAARFTFVENTRYAETNNMYSLYLVRQYLTEEFLLMNADLVFDPGVISLLLTMKNTAVAVDKGCYLEESMKVSVVDGVVNRISKGISQSESYGCSIDVYKIAKHDVEVLVGEMKNIIQVNSDENQWTEVLLDRLFAVGKIAAQSCDIGANRWFEIDNYEDLHTAELLFNNHLPQLSSKKLYFIDRDGTMSIGNKKIEGVNKFFQALRDRKKQFYILTNNSSKPAPDHMSGFASQGIDLTEGNILVSLDAALEYFRQHNIYKIYFVANEHVKQYAADQSFTDCDSVPEAILLTYDTDITYQKLVKACFFIRNGIPYYATHADMVCPTEAGNIPDIGTFIEVIRLTTGQTPAIIFGKPNKEMVLPILNKLNLSPSDAVIVGDRLYTDIQLAQNAGITSVLVLSGETSREDYENSDIKADIVINSLNELAPFI